MDTTTALRIADASGDPVTAETPGAIDPNRISVMIRARDDDGTAMPNGVRLHGRHVHFDQGANQLRLWVADVRDLTCSAGIVEAAAARDNGIAVTLARAETPQHWYQRFDPVTSVDLYAVLALPNDWSNSLLCGRTFRAPAENGREFFDGDWLGSRELRVPSPTTSWATFSTCGDHPAPCNCDDPVTHNGH